MRARLAATLLGLAALAAADVGAQTMYKWIDAQGRVQYSDRPPKDFKGEVTKIEADQNPPPVVAPAKPVPGKGEAASPEPPAEDIAARRRAIRERLAADVARACARVEAARKALAEAGGPEPDERQVIQQRVAKGGNAKPQPLPNPDPTQGRVARGGMHGMTARSNCREVVGAGGKKATICPTMVPGDAYFDRIRLLEEALSKAEEDLAAAEAAYRRGVD